MEMRLLRSIECRLRKLNYFFFAPHSLTHSTINGKTSVCSISLIIVSLFMLLLFDKVRVFSSINMNSFVLGMILLCCMQRHAKQQPQTEKSVKKKYRWNLWDFKSEVKPIIMQRHHNCTCISCSNDIAACKFGHINVASRLPACLFARLLACFR